MVDQMVLCDERLEYYKLGLFYLTRSLKILMHIRAESRIQKKFLVSMLFAVKLKMEN